MGAARMNSPRDERKPLIIVGGGGFGREIAWLARECAGEWDVVGILDNDRNGWGTTLCGVPVLGGDGEAIRHNTAWFIVAIGSPRLRKKAVSALCRWL